jgi:hypothetical protein
MLESYCHKAKLGDALDILDLGCGSLSPFAFTVLLGLLNIYA